MNKLSFSLVTTFLFSLALYSQVPPGFYAKVVGNYTTLNSSDLYADSGIGYGFGVSHNSGYSESFSYTFEFLYNKSFLNFKSVDPFSGNTYDTKMIYNNFNAGMYFNYYVLKPEEDEFFVGPQGGVSFTMGANFEKAKLTEENQYATYLPYLLDDNSFDIPSVTTNIGVGITGGYNNFRFDLRYDIGLGNILEGTRTNDYDEFNNYTGPALSGKINTFTVGVNYLFLSTRRKL